jgi:hypothetical protein
MNEAESALIWQMTRALGKHRLPTSQFREPGGL